MNIYDPDSPEADWQRERQAERRFLREMHEPFEAPAAVDLAETGCTPQEIEEPTRLDPPAQLSLFPELDRPVRVSTRIYSKEVA